jgi:hypothetical protein
VSGATLPGDPDVEVEALTGQARAILHAHWREPGFCVPNATTYPWQWLWDSCFHAVCWAHLGEGDRAVSELSNLFAHQSDDGFVPHMTYWQDGTTHATFWGRPGTSAITQPPMYGHALAELHRLGVTVPDQLVARAGRGLQYLFATRFRDGVGPVILHPWESGCDDSPRWDAWCASPWSFDQWKVVKGELVDSLTGADGSSLAADGSPGGNTRFEVTSAGFAALVAFNALELAVITDDDRLRSEAGAVADGLDRRWDPTRSTWTDLVVVGPDATAGVRTLDALLPVLVSADSAAVSRAFTVIDDDGGFGGRFGPAATHRAEPSFDPGAYWRGPAWPHLTYLLWVAATRRGLDLVAAGLRRRLLAGAGCSGFAEYWQPDTGAGLGAVPQSWAALAAVVAQAPRA